MTQCHSLFAILIQIINHYDFNSSSSTLVVILFKGQNITWFAMFNIANNFNRLVAGCYLGGCFLVG